MALSLNEQGQKRIKFIEKEHGYFLFFRVVVFILFFFFLPQPTASKHLRCDNMHIVCAYTMHMYICIVCICLSV